MIILCVTGSIAATESIKLARNLKEMMWKLNAPATANTISKFAYKLADDPISTLLITAYGHDTPILFVPSMHDSMFKAIKDNIDKIKERVLLHLSNLKWMKAKQNSQIKKI